MLYRKDNQANFMQPSDRGTSPSTFDYDNFSADLEQTCLACEYLAELSGSMESTVASLGSLPSATGIDKDGNYAQALKCVKGGSGLSGFGGSVTSAYNRAKAVRNAILRAQGISEDLFDQKGKEIAYGLLGIEMPEEVVPDTPQAHVDAWEALRESDPEAYREQAAAGAAAAQAKNPEDWTIDDVLALLAYQEDLSGRYSTAEREYQEIAGWDWGTGISDDAREKYTALKNEKKALEDLLKANGLMDYTFTERAWQDISAAGKALISEGADVFHAIGEGDFRGAWTELGEFNTQLYATGAVVTEATISGGAKLLEYVDDGSHMLMGALATPYTYLADQIAGTDITGTMWDAVMDDVARDKVGEAREWFYEGTALGRAINENSALSYDSAGAQGIMNVSTKGAEIVAATAVTVCTGGAAAPFIAAGIGFLEGMGQEGERRFSLTDADGNYTNRTATDVALSALKGVGKASEWYMYGNVGASLVNGALGTAGASGAVDMANLTGNNARDALTRLVRSGDFYLDMASSAANATTTRITTGKWNWGEMALDFGLSILGNYGGEYLNVAQANKARAAATGVDISSAKKMGGIDMDDAVDGVKHADELTEAELAGVWGAGEGTPISPKTDASVFSPAKQAQLNELAGSSDVPTARFTDYDSYDRAVTKARARLDEYDPRLAGFYEEGIVTGANKPHFIAYEEHNFLHVETVADESRKVSNALNQLIDEGHVTGLSKLDDGIVEASGLCHDLGMREGGQAILFDGKTFSSPQEIVDDFGKKIRKAHPSVSATTVLENGIGGENKEMIAALDFLHSKSNSGVKNVLNDDEIMGMLKALSDGAESGHYTFDITKFVDEVDGKLVPKPDEFAKLKSGAIALRAGDARAAKTGFNQAGEMIDVVKHADPAKTFSQAPGFGLDDLCSMEADDSIVDIVSRNGTRTAVDGAGDNAFSRRIVIGERNARSVGVEALDGMLVYTDEVLTESSPASTLKHGIVEKFGEYYSYKGAVTQKQIIKLPPNCSDELFSFYKQYLPEEEIVKNLGVKGDIIFDDENRIISFIFGGGIK